MDAISQLPVDVCASSVTPQADGAAVSAGTPHLFTVPTSAPSHLNRDRAGPSLDDTSLVDLRGAHYTGAAITELLEAAHTERRYECPVWATLEALGRAALDFAVEPHPVTVPLSGGTTVTLYNVSETAFFRDLRAGAAGGPERKRSDWGVAVLRALNERRPATSFPRAAEGSRDAREREWFAEPRNVLGKPLRAAVRTALKTKYGRYAELQRKAAVWVESSTLIPLGLRLLPGEGCGFVMEETEPFLLAKGANATFNAPRVWYNASQLVPEEGVDLSMESCQSNPKLCLKPNGLQYGVVLSCLLHAYCRKWGYNGHLAVFITPERLRTRGGALLPAAESSGGETKTVEPFTTVVAGEVCTLWHIDQTTLRDEILRETVNQRNAHFSAGGGGVAIPARKAGGEVVTREG